MGRSGNWSIVYSGGKQEGEPKESKSEAKWKVGGGGRDAFEVDGGGRGRLVVERLDGTMGKGAAVWIALRSGGGGADLAMELQVG